MALQWPRDVRVAGIGTSAAFAFDLGKSPLAVQTEAFVAALEDAGLSRDDVDGVVTAHGSPFGVDYDEFAVTAGLHCRWATQLWSHGRWATNMVAEAAMAIRGGLASVVAVVNTSTTGRAYGRHLRALGGGARESARDVGGGHGEWEIHGLETPGAATALVAQRYMDKYGATPDDLAEIPLAQRRSAALNDMAIMRGKPMDRQSYFSEPHMVGPFRRADYCLSNEGATCLLLTGGQRAASLRQPAVTVAGVAGLQASRDDSVLFARAGLGVGIGADYPFDAAPYEEIYAASGVDRQSIDGLYVYDSFSSNVWMVLERFGFCGEGEAPKYLAERGLGLGSPMPVNSNGGLLSEAHLLGLGHLVEMVRQLRGTAGPRQIPGAAALQWATPIGDSLIFTRG